MNETATDWQGRLRVSDLVRDALGLVLRQPVAGAIAPAVIIGAAIYATSGLDFEVDVLYELARGRGSRYWLGSEGLIVAPLMSPCWLALAWGETWDEGAREQGWGARAKQIARATLIMAIMVLGFAFGTVMGVLGGAVLAVLLALSVPVLAREEVGVARSVRRSVELGTGTRISVIGAWVVLQVIAAVAMGAMILALAFVPELSTDFPNDALELVGVGLTVGFAGLRWGLTMAVSVAAYGRLSHARAALDPEAWLEVFR